MNYVAHVCRNSKLSTKNENYCDKIWIDKDLTRATTTPPTWKYCEECCRKLGIDYYKQTPTSNLSKKELESRNKRVEKAKSILKRKTNSDITKEG